MKDNKMVPQHSLHVELSNVFSKIRRLQPNEVYCHGCQTVHKKSEKCKCNDVGEYPLFTGFIPTH